MTNIVSFVCDTSMSQRCRKAEDVDLFTTRLFKYFSWYCLGIELRCLPRLWWTGRNWSDGCTDLLHSSVWSSANRPALKVAIALIIFQQTSGQPSILSFAPVLLHSVGLNGNTTILNAILTILASSLTIMLGIELYFQFCGAILGTGITK